MKSMACSAAVAVLTMLGGAALAADVDNGRQLAQRHCGVCHAMAPAGGAKMGPNLWGVVGRKIGGVPGYRYHDIKPDGRVWSTQTLAQELAAPSDRLHGGRTKFKGLSDQQELDDVVAYLGTLK